MFKHSTPLAPVKQREVAGRGVKSSLAMKYVNTLVVQVDTVITTGSYLEHSLVGLSSVLPL